MKIVKLFHVLAAFAGALCLPVAAHAHYLWATLSQKTLTVAFQERPGDPALDLAERFSALKLHAKAGKASVQSDGFYRRAAVSEQVAGSSLDYGVIDRSDSGRGVFWLRYYAKACATAEASKTSLGFPVEASAEPKGEGSWVVHVTKDGKPVEGAEVVVESGSSAAEEHAGVKTDARGNAEVKADSSFLALRALVVENANGLHDGKSYAVARTYCTLTIGELVQSKPLTAMIQEAFGNDHEVVQRTRFIQTVLAGKVTKLQVQDHLRQRALVHEALDRILRGRADMPYKQDQKEVLDLLRNDVDAVGAAWPKPSDASRLTRDFLAKLNESEKRGPYYALGVFHVYYGGITHGGRDIGAKITETIGIDLVYYQMSDGYSAYAEAVNKIKDPVARAEMIRGGVEAYRYIIAINDATGK